MEQTTIKDILIVGQVENPSPLSKCPLPWCYISAMHLIGEYCIAKDLTDQTNLSVHGGSTELGFNPSRSHDKPFAYQSRATLDSLRAHDLAPSSACCLFHTAVLLFHRHSRLLP